MNRISTGIRNERNTNTSNVKKRKYPWDVYKRKIGVVGLGNSGKTVLLTSLIDQIKNDGFKDITINEFKKQTVQNMIGKKFPQELYRRRLSKREWPEKTGEPLHYRCSFFRKDFGNGKMKLDLEFFDVPGERIADVAMVGNSFSKWSEFILDQLENVAGMEQKLENYMKVLEQPEVSHEEVLSAYRTLLAECLEEYRALISPSTFYLDLNGAMIRSIEEENEVSKRVLGCNKECQFAPIPSALFKEKKKEFINFEKYYKKYNKEVITPIFKRLKSCNHLLVVVDVPTILATSVFRHAETDVILEFLFNACNPHMGKLRAAWNFMASHEWRWKKIDHVAAIGTKTDLVRVGDTDKYYSLLSALVSRDMNNLNSKRHRIETEVFTCAAVESTSLSENEENRCGFLMKNPNGPGYKDPPGDGEVAMDDYYVDPLDVEWPDHWKERDYIFPGVYPLVPKNVKKPPFEKGLKNIFNFICEAGS